ncbi:MAG: lipid II flippase MurJ [Bryobacteraceae bacterium]
MDAEAQAEKRRIPFFLSGLAGNLFTAGSFGALVKVIGAVKVAVTARYFGAGSELDAYLIAFLLPSFFADVLAGSIRSALVPALVRTQKAGDPEAARSLSQSVATAGTALLGAVAILLAAGAYFIPWSNTRSDLVRPLLFVLLPVLPLSALSTTCRSVLNAHRQFWIAAAIPVVTPTLCIALLVAVSNTWGVFALALGTLAGNLVEALVLVIAVRRIGYPMAARWSRASLETLRDVFSQYVPVVAGALVLGGSTFIDQGFATLLGTGGIAVLTYGTKLTTALLALGPAALGTAILPYLSKMSAEEDWLGIRSVIRRSVVMIAAAVIPLTALLIVLSEPLIRLYLQRGQFSGELAVEVTRVQQFSLIHVPIALILTLAMGLTASLRANRLFVPVAVVGLGINAISDFVLMKYLGVAGIALSDAVAGLAMLIYLSVLLNRLISRNASATS